MSEKETIICSRCGSFIGDDGLDICPVCGNNLVGEDGETYYEKE